MDHKLYAAALAMAADKGIRRLQQMVELRLLLVSPGEQS